jgi:ABC-type multidrug transport system ATPase subunit
VTDAQTPAPTCAAGARDARAPALRAREVAHGYRSAWSFTRRNVLDGVDLELARGAALGLLGPNGSGKSTLLRLCAGLEEPDRGSIEVLGLAPSAAAARARVGYCPEEAPWPLELSTREALELRALSDGHAPPRARELAGEWLDAVGLTAAAGTRLGACSRGMRRRFGLAQALLGDPELVLLDEPTAGLDAEGLLRFDGLVSRARARGATLVMSSHALSDLARHCDQLALLCAGRLAARGSARALADEARELELLVVRDARASTEAHVSTADLVAALRAAGATSVDAYPGPRFLVGLYAGAAARDAARGAAPQ